MTALRPGGEAATVIRILPFVALSDTRRAELAVEAILFETARRTYPPGPERDAFKERWLGRYLQYDAGKAFVAVDASRDVVGYLVGAFDDPARTPRFGDLSYFADFASLTSRFPAHLHINLTADWRSLGIGERLIEAFVGQARSAGVPGVHVVTGEGARNTRFYAKCGFRQEGRLDWNGHPLVLLGKPIVQAAS